jgi:hypothetical protein
MVAVTGALAIDNVEPQADIDYLIVTEPGRLWLCRALVIAVVRRAARQGVVLCPNYFLSERAVALNDHSLFTAHELLQMVPVAGPETYRQMIAANAWSTTFLPNARPLAPLSGVAVEAVPPGEIGRRRPTMVRDLEPSRWRTMAESLARLPPGGMVDRWEMRRKLRRFAARGITAEVAFNADCCKGHFEGHGQRIMAAYQERLRGI